MMRFYDPEECTGRDGYPFEWHDTIKHAVREQAGHRCVRCQHPYVKGAGQWSPCDRLCEHSGPTRTEDGVTYAEWRILTVHHLDGVKGNCRWWNLAALCQRCHLEIQGKVKMDRRWLRPHSEWFKPYVAAYYAFTILGEDLTRAEVEARMAELLALEVRQLTIGESA